MVLQASDISILTAYAAGFLTFFAPCHLPLVPAYLSFIGGVSLHETEQQHSHIRRRLFVTSAWYVFGFLVVFTLFGLAASWLGGHLALYRRIMQVLGGALMIFVGASLVGLFESRLFSSSKQVRLSNHITRFAWLNAFFLGLAFGFSWTPCIGPVLAVILFWASQTATSWSGIALLVVYGLGLGTPFLLLSLFVDRGNSLLQKHGALLHRFTQLAGIFMMALGVLLIGNWLFVLSATFTKFSTPELYFFKVQ